MEIVFKHIIQTVATCIFYHKWNLKCSDFFFFFEQWDCNSTLKDVQVLSRAKDRICGKCRT